MPETPSMHVPLRIGGPSDAVNAGSGTVRHMRKEANGRNRGSKPHRALKAPIPIVEGRGKVRIAEGCTKSLHDFTIVSAIPFACICVKFATRILAPPGFGCIGPRRS